MDYRTPNLYETTTAKLRAAGCVYAEEEARLLIAEARDLPELHKLADRRIAGDPLEQVLGWAEFHGLRVGVEPGVFVPRRRTEFLVDQAIALCGPGAVVLDLCCGSGALGLAVAKAVRQIELYASDIEPAAVHCAEKNLGAVGGNVYKGDLYQPLPQELAGRVNILMANAPYVPSRAVEFLPREAKLYEPRVTLDGGDDGLRIHQNITAGASHWLAPRGSLLIEVSEQQVDAASAMFRENGLRVEVVVDDELEAIVLIGENYSL